MANGLHIFDFPLHELVYPTASVFQGINFYNILSSTNILYCYHGSYLQDDDRIYVFEKPSSAQQENQLIIPQEVWIRINNTTPNDTANYTCIAENAAGKNETQMHIIIQREFFAATVQRFENVRLKQLKCIMKVGP